jgi:hypothetical protein
MRPGKALRSSGRTKDLLNHGAAGKGDKDRTSNNKRYRENRENIQGLSDRPVGFHKSYGSPLGLGSTKRTGPLDKIQVNKAKKAWQKYQQEYEMLDRDCTAMNREAGVDNQGHPL